MTIVLGILGALCAVVAIVLAVIAVRVYRKAKDALRDGVQVPATIVDHVQYKATRGGSVAASVAEFIAADGVVRRCESKVRTSPARHSKGQAVQVVYSPGNPDEARIVDVQDLWAPPIALGFLSFASLVFAAVCVWGMLSGE